MSNILRIAQAYLPRGCLFMQQCVNFQTNPCSFIVYLSLIHSFPFINKAKKEVPFSVAIRNGELMHEYFPKYSHMGTAIIK